jgi:hypothetical protein
MAWKKKTPVVSTEPDADNEEQEDDVDEDELQKIKEYIKNNKSPAPSVVKAKARSGQNWSAQNVPIQTESMIYNARENRYYSLAEAVVEILNRTEDN